MSRTRRRLKREIRAALDGTGPIARSEVERWIASEDLRVMEELYRLILGQPNRITPPLTIEEICAFAQVYFRKSFLETPRGTYAPTLEFIHWFIVLWTNPSIPRQYADNLKRMLAELYRSGTRVTRDRVVYGLLEHLCENPKVARYFSDWKDDPDLKTAYTLALEWAEGKGSIGFWPSNS